MSSPTSKKCPKKPDPLPPSPKKNLLVLFITLFLDLVGFSIIFPIFPALLTHYLSVDSQNVFLQSVLKIANTLMQWGGSPSSIPVVVLFGGIVVAIFSLMQFLFSPLWGSLSDRIGRKPVLIISIGGITLSYLLWMFAGNFTLMILSRMLGGLMAGNISTASAVVSDLTTEKTRSRGMAIIGMAFGLGFVIGPALGGVTSLLNPLEINPDWQGYGINPFSFVALVAFCLSLINFFLVITIFKESLAKEKSSHATKRRINPIALFRPLPYVGVNITNMSYFFFIVAFSGMEFSLTFLATERLAFLPMDNALMFTFVGIMSALVQGGYVRRHAATVGERQMSQKGLVLLILGLVVTGLSHSRIVLYTGLFFLACGSAMIIPCLTALVSLYTPKHEQGLSLGIFRSLGALGRVVGPLVAALMYFRMGATAMYLAAALLALLPLTLVMQLQKVPFRLQPD